MWLTAEPLIRELRRSGIKNEQVLDAISEIPREKFVMEEYLEEAYSDTALPIDCGQTISQPYIVALMTERLLKNAPQKVLEIGTGSGYQAAILSCLVKEVYSLERIYSLYESAKHRLEKLGIMNVSVIYGDGQLGYPVAAPFDGIMVTAATDEVPEMLLNQLSDGGQLILPLGSPGFQKLTVYTRHKDSFSSESLGGVVFVPLLSGKE